MAALDRLISATLAKGLPLGSAFRAWDSRLFIRKNVRAHLQASLLRVRGSFTGYQFQLGPLPAFVERLQPECLGDVQNAFRQPMQRRRAWSEAILSKRVLHDNSTKTSAYVPQAVPD